MFRKIKYFIIMMSVFSPYGQLLAHAAGGNGAAVDAALAAYENSQVNASLPAGRGVAGGVPQWKSSLGEIQAASTALLETNARLMGEENQLASAFEDLTARIEALRAGNEKQARELERLERSGGTEEMLRIQDALDERGRALAEQKTALAAMQARERSSRNKLALARLRVAELEIDRKSVDLDLKLREDAVLAGLRADKVRIRAGTEKLQEQALLLREKIVELRRVDSRDLPQLREMKARNDALKDRLRALQAQAAEARAKLDVIVDKKARLEAGHNVLRVRGLSQRSEALAGQLWDNSRRLQALRKEDADAQEELAVIQGDIEKLGRQNAAMDRQIGDLRENIALLEYKVNTLQRYKDRNKPGR